MTNMIAPIIKGKRFRKILTVLLVIMPLLVVGYFSLRNILLRNILTRQTELFSRRFDAELRVGKASFDGFITLRIDSLMLKPRQGDTLLTIQRIIVVPSFKKLLIGRLTPAWLQVDGFNMNLTRYDTLTNYMFLFGHRSSDTTTTHTTHNANYALVADRLASLVFGRLPANTRLTRLRVVANLNGNRFVISAPGFNLSDHETDNLIYITNQGQTAPLILTGRLASDRREASFSIIPADSSHVILPYIDWKWNARVSFDTLRFKMAFGAMKGASTTLSGQGLFAGLQIQQPMLSDKVVVFNRLEGNFVYHFGRDYIELDSTSTFRINSLSLNPWFRVYPQQPIKIDLSIHKTLFPASDLFESLPTGLFLNLQGMKVRGNLSYDLRFNLDMASPDSLTFFSNLGKENFDIVEFGATNLSIINTSFMHTAFEHGQPARTFQVGPENPNFRSIEAISPYLRNAIMTAEDGGFMWHRGFLPDAFRSAIIDNVKAGRFVRGGSTISMQLVKNVFLNRNKTITRKLEEALIVWLIENKRLSTKERMYEIYLNIIEMGPLVYGIEEGARFYFNKDASELTLAESIFMASIVPHPKWFKYSFDEQGNLRDFLTPYFSFLANRMAKKNFITEEEAATLQPIVKLTGRARTFITPADSLSADSLRMTLPVWKSE